MTTSPGFDAETTSHSGAAFFATRMESALEKESINRRLLVVGSGAGHEAAYLKRRLRADVDAIDLGVEPDPEFVGLNGLNFQQASALELPFDDRSFDIVFYHHVIEHVADPARSLQEIDRVIRDDGWLFVGTPNRHRIVSSVGAHRQATWEPSIKNKLKDNLQDWNARIRGQFRNELGAHAGFSQGELDKMLAPYFSKRIWLTREYLDFKYENHTLRNLVRLATTPPVRWFLAPAIYVLCQR